MFKSLATSTIFHHKSYLNFGRVRFFSTVEKNIKILLSSADDIHFNLATEEYLYEHSDLKYPTLFLWKNDKTVVIGRHQNPWKECFLQEMYKDNVKLSRRKSGGGAVYHDLENICFTFLTPIPLDQLPLSAKDTNNKILIAALKSFGVDAVFSGRNDITVNNKKVSGSAYQVSLGKKDGSGRKALQHGTMLIRTDPNAIQKYLNPNKAKLKSKGVDSVISRVDNLGLINSAITCTTLFDAIKTEFIKNYDDHAYTIEHLDHSKLEHLPIVDKIFKEYSSDKWLYQQTPEFSNNIETRFDWGVIDVYVKVEQGNIKEGKVFSDCLFPEFIENINTLLNSGIFSYDSKGINSLSVALSDTYKGNQQLCGFIKELEQWLLKSI